MASEGSLLFIERYTKAFQGLLSKSDGRDKLLAAMQYAAMFTSAGAPGVAQQVQKSLAGARKPFRVMKVGPASERPYELHSGRPFASQALSACHAFRFHNCSPPFSYRVIFSRFIFTNRLGLKWAHRLCVYACDGTPGNLMLFTRALMWR